MLNKKIELKELEKFEKVTLRIDDSSVLELSLIDDELSISIVKSYLKNTKLQRLEKERFNHIMEQCNKLSKKDIIKCCEKSYEKNNININSLVDENEDIEDETEKITISNNNNNKIVFH